MSILVLWWDAIEVGPVVGAEPGPRFRGAEELL